MEIVFRLEHQIIARADHNVLAAKSRNYVRAKFELLSDDWTAPITVIFNNYTVVLDENNSCVVPWEVLEQPGTFRVSAFCGDLHTTTQESVQVFDTGYTEGETPQPPTPSVYQGLTKMVQTAVESVQSIGAEAGQSQQGAQTAAADAAASAAAAAEQAVTAKNSADAAAQSAQESKDAAASVPAVDDEQATEENLWSAAKIAQEMDSLSRNIDYLLGVNTPETFSDVLAAVRSGFAPQYFGVGDQIKANWTDVSTVYEDPFDIVQLECSPELESGETVRGMMLQQHYANAHYCIFDAQEALYDAQQELPAGTYHFTVSGHPTSGENGKRIQFTLSHPIPAGGQLVFADSAGYGQPLAGQSISTYSGPTSFQAIETVPLSEGEEGTDLGSTNGKGNLNHLQRAFRGSGRWKTSLLRQYLNSSAPAGQWWTKQDKWDRASDFINTVPGFMAGFDEDFLAILRAVKVQTVRDTIMSGGGIDVTYDFFFPLSLEQNNIVPQIAGAEGETLPYWEAMAQADTTGNLDNGRYKQYKTYPDMIFTSLSQKGLTCHCWLRSAQTGNTHEAWAILTTGMNSHSPANLRYHCAPACVIC